MTKQIQYFGGKTLRHIVLEDGREEELRLDRDLWFDRDFDGRWLVGVTTKHRTGAETTGAIVVKDTHVAAFIDLLGRLVAKPEHSADEQFIIGPDWDGRLPEE